MGDAGGQSRHGAAPFACMRPCIADGSCIDGRALLGCLSFPKNEPLAADSLHALLSARIRRHLGDRKIGALPTAPVEPRDDGIGVSSSDDVSWRTRQGDRALSADKSL